MGGLRLPFSNRYVFAKVMQDNPDLCREMLERILGVPIKRVVSLQVEAESTNIARRSVRFDVFLRSDEAAFEVEMQTYEQRDFGKRMRFYRSQLDRLLLGKGAGFEELLPVYVIFICTFDPFSSGLPIYTLRTTCMEDQTVEVRDGAVSLVLNAGGDLAMTTPAMASLLEYVGTGRVRREDNLIGKLQLAVEDALSDEEWVRNMSWLDWDLRDAKAAAQKEGRAEGRAEGRTQERERLGSLAAAMERAGCTSSEIVAALQSGDVDALLQRYGVAPAGAPQP